MLSIEIERGRKYMKTYIIWLHSGDYIEGRIDEQTATQLVAYYKKRFKRRLYTFQDSEGIVVVNIRKVLAIGINEITERNKTGF